MSKQSRNEFQEVTVHLRKDFQYDLAEPLEDNDPKGVLNMLSEWMWKVDMDTYCLLEFDVKSRLLRVVPYTPGTFRRELRHPKGLLQRIILDRPHSVVAVHLTEYDFPKQINWDAKAAGVMGREVETSHQLGILLSLANIHLRDYIVSDYGMKKYFALSENELLKIPNDEYEQYLSQGKPITGMEVPPERATVRRYDNRYPAEIRPVWSYPEHEDIQTPADAIFAVRGLIQDIDREVCGIINLDGWKPLNFHLSSIGNLNNTVVDNGLLLRSTLLSSANAVILFHNHPTGDVEPSYNDILATEKMRCLCGKCGITMMDHVIIGFNNDFCFSFYRNGIFDAENGESPFRNAAEHIRESSLEDALFRSEQISSENIAAEQTYSHKRQSPRR